MSRELITLTPEMEINRAMNLLIDNRISGAPVLDATGNLVGMLSQKDCLKAALHASYYREWGGTLPTTCPPIRRRWMRISTLWRLPKCFWRVLSGAFR
jgi:CBS-domain-containing membrane protein